MEYYNNNFTIDDKGNGRYTISYFNDGHFIEEIEVNLEDLENLYELIEEVLM